MLLDAAVVAARDGRAESAARDGALEEVPRMLRTPERGGVVQDCAPLRGEQLALNLE